MSQSSSFLFCCRSPVSTLFTTSADSSGQIMLRGIHVYTGLPAWPVCADLLVDSATRELIGLSYAVETSEVELVRHYCSPLDQSHVTLYLPYDSVMQSRYVNEYAHNARLELLWSPRPKVTAEFCQLMDPLWYYSYGNDSMSRGQVIGIGITRFDDLLVEYGLIHPVI